VKTLLVSRKVEALYEFDHAPVLMAAQWLARRSRIYSADLVHTKRARVLIPGGGPVQDVGG
jgi:hypothetical protein